jgi:beta-glucosidase
MRKGKIMSKLQNFLVLLFFSFFSVSVLNAQNARDYSAEAKAIVQKMTLEEKALLLSGKGWWQTYPIERVGIPSIFMTDGPHGLRKSLIPGLGKAVPATCFPTASALASSWDTDLINEVGKKLAQESKANDVQILLGPGINMKRSPLGGRNFEYFSEDPYLAGKLAAAYIKGVQSLGVGTSLKHFAVNNQEFERMANDSILDERTMREIYLPAFEIAVKESQPWSVMSSYNLVNGTYASENKYLLEDILRGEWGFEGFVVSDWGAVNNRVKGLVAGNNLEMLGSGEYNRNKIIAAAKSGEIPQARLDEMVAGLLAMILKGDANRDKNAKYSVDEHHEFARRVAGESIVLLKNENTILPLDTAKNKKIAIVGKFAKTPRYQGALSSQVNPTKISNAFDELSKIVGKDVTLTYAEAYDMEGETTEAKLSEAKNTAKNSDLTIVFAGLPDKYESEGFDRESMSMPESHLELIKMVNEVQTNAVVVLMNGSAIEMPWKNNVKAIVEAWLTGQAGGGAIADVLTGRVNPSGKLQETFPVRLEDTPTYLDFPGKNGRAFYGEGIYIGYRYYDKKNIEPLFPFGFGLSYTTFAYSDLMLDKNSMTESDELSVSLKVKNTGKVAGKEIVQLYVHKENAVISRPEKELRAFAKVDLKPGEEKTVSFKLSKRDFAFYDVDLKDWKVNSGKYEILAGSSSRNLPLKEVIDVTGSNTSGKVLNQNSMIKEFKGNPNCPDAYGQLLMGFGYNPSAQPPANETPLEKFEREKSLRGFIAFLNDLPINRLPLFTQGRFNDEMIAGMVAKCQQSN